MAVNFSPFAGAGNQFFDNSGNPLAGGLIYTYDAGTTNPAVTYTSNTGLTANSNPIVLDSAGRVPNEIWLTEATSYKFVLKTSVGTTLGTYDNVPGLNDFSSTTGASFIGAADGAAGTNWTTVQGFINRIISSAGSAYVGFLQAGSGAVARTMQAKVREYPVSPMDFGAVGNGIADDTAEVQLAADRARAINGTLVFPGGYIFGISSLVYIRNGVRAVKGEGGWIKCLSNGNIAPSGILLAGKAQGEATDVSFCRVEGLNIDRNNQWSVGIYLSNSDNCQVLGNVIINGASGLANDYAGIYVPSFNTSATGAHDILIANNYVKGNATTLVAGGVDGIAVSGTYAITAPYTTITEQWKATFTLPPTVNPAYNIQVENNIVIGGYYGISFVETRYSTIIGNQVVSNIRNISQQMHCISNLIADNLCRDSNSSGINNGFGVDDCTFRGNKIYTTRAQGEALLQAYIACNRNLFENNHTFSGSLDPQYHIYTAIHTNNNTFRNNVLRGTCWKAYIGLESAWDTSVGNIAHRVYPGTAAEEDYANAPSNGNTIEGNIIEGVSAVPAIWLAQVNSDAIVCPLTNTRVINNTVVGDGYLQQFEMFENNAGSLSDVVLRFNTFDAAAPVTRFTFPRGRLHFLQQDNNTLINIMPTSTPFRSFADGDTTPSVAYADYWQFANTGATSVTMFDSGVDGQEIVVRGSSNTTIVHNTSFIRLKGGVNATGLTSDNLFRFKQISGIWFEQSRNF